MQMRGGKHRPGEAVVAESLRTFPERSVGALLRSRAERFGDKEAVRFRTRSGRWQELSFRQLDYLYVTGWSLWGDVRLILRTLPVIMRPRRAY